MGSVSFRRATPDDDPATFSVFRRSLWDYLRRNGLLEPDDPAEAPVERAWPRWIGMYGHLRDTAAEHWVAEGRDGVIGYARSIERDGLVELTEFFVDPEAQTRGVGGGCSSEPSRSAGADTARSSPRSIRARSPSTCASASPWRLPAPTSRKRPQPVEIETDLELEPAGPEHLDEILQLEAQVLGHRRQEDISFLLSDRPAVLYRRRGAAVGYGFDCNEHGQYGPIAVLDPADLPVASAHLETDAHTHGLERLSVSAPLSNRAALSWSSGTAIA